MTGNSHKAIFYKSFLNLNSKKFLLLFMEKGGINGKNKQKTENVKAVISNKM